MNKINDCKAIHETTLKTLIDIWDGLQSLKNDENKGADGKFSIEKFLGNRNNNLRPNSFSSIAKAASNLTLVFPVICSRNISIENASMVNKALEKNAASMMQKLFASWQVSSDKVGSVQDYIRQFHTNINTGASSLDDVFELSSKVVSNNESVVSNKEIERLFKEDILNPVEGCNTFFDLDPAGVGFVFNLNFLGTLLPSQVFCKGMALRGQGTVINISSMNAFRPLTKIPAYSAAKAAISNFTAWLATHMSEVGIRVNAIAPGFFLTNQNRTLLTNPDGSLTPRGNTILSHTPMGRFGTPEDLFGTLLWLVDDEASGFVNGIVVPVDGGFAAFSGV